MINLKKSMCCLFLAASSTVAIAQTSVVDLVNPIIGTNGMGHTFPGACVPLRTRATQSGYRYHTTQRRW